MDQLHEELKHPVFSLPMEQLSDTEEPIHQAKRLLGGTSSPVDSQDNGKLCLTVFAIFINAVIIFFPFW